ncbi:MAG TPA: helix-turn-helix transcriptional regulator [Pyrinomonadaceae bacterium]|nr:helix-turn-helix transcriptional regulator [Pyrinomonadaceae bacterium]
MTGEELKQWRTERGLTQSDLSEILSLTEGDIPQSRISEWERGVYKVPDWMPHELNAVTFLRKDQKHLNKLPKLPTRKITWPKTSEK